MAWPWAPEDPTAGASWRSSVNTYQGSTPRPRRAESVLYEPESRNVANRRQATEDPGPCRASTRHVEQVVDRRPAVAPLLNRKAARPPCRRLLFQHRREDESGNPRSSLRP